MFSYYLHKRATPVGVASLIAKTLAGTKNIEEEFRKLGLYFATVLIGLLVWVSLVAFGIYFFAKRRNPFRMLGSFVPSAMIVFACGSTYVHWDVHHEAT